MLTSRQTAQRYRAEAERCLKMADEAENLDIRSQLSNIAATYRRLADQVEGMAKERRVS
jgi:hypothetical protein